VLDHVAKPEIAAARLDPWRADLRRLAELPHVSCKLSGLVTEANWGRWTPADFRPYLDVVLEAFGPARLMFGSDWPVCLLAASYADVIGLARGAIAALSRDEQAAILGANAARFYGLEPTTGGTA
jgi:L-fuconolactonase